MISGYLSREAVNDLLAVKEGEKDFLKVKNKELQDKIDYLESKLLLANKQ